MSSKSDRLGGASEIAAAQAQRLRRLRALVCGYQIDAAEAGGVSADTWSRMETAQARLDCVALARWAAAYEVPAEYVITGRLYGLSDELLRLVARAEEAAAPANGPVGGPRGPMDTAAPTMATGAGKSGAPRSRGRLRRVASQPAERS